MLHKLVMATVGLMAFSGLQAQDVCTIKGHIEDASLRYTQKKVEKVYLNKIDEYERLHVVDSAKLVKGNFKFSYKMAAGEPIMLFALTGFDNGVPVLFVEPGEVKVHIRKAAYPNGALVGGTKNNDLYTEYKKISERAVQEQKDSLKVINAQKGEAYLDSEAGMTEWMRIGAESLLTCTADRIRFVLDHNDSPLAPMLMERELYFMLSNTYAERLFSSLSPKLKDHPYYRSFNNVVRALELKVGSELPDITLPLVDGKKGKLSDYRGKYVLLDFWASWCGPCRREIPFLKQVYEAAKGKEDKFMVLSFSLDSKENEWKKAIEAHGLNLPNWVHASDLMGWQSPNARFMGVKAVPQIILIDPEGKAISFTLRGEEMVRRVKQILAGDLYYLNQGGEK